jgi:LytS/YehU family sensor histidine kinase
VLVVLAMIISGLAGLGGVVVVTGGVVAGVVAGVVVGVIAGVVTCVATGVVALLLQLAAMEISPTSSTNASKAMHTLLLLRVLIFSPFLKIVFMLLSQFSNVIYAL